MTVVENNGDYLLTYYIKELTQCNVFTFYSPCVKLPLQTKLQLCKKRDE